MKKRVIVIGKDITNWSVDCDRKNLINHLSHIDEVNLVNNIFRADIFYVIWHEYILNYRSWVLKIIKKFGKKKIIVVITNDITFYEKKFFRLNNLVDLWISPNKKISHFLQRHNAKYVQLPFYVSHKIFNKLNITRKLIAQKLNIPFDKIINKKLIGSFQRDSLGLDLTKPKWQKNPELLIETVKKLPTKDYLLILAGPRRHYIIKQCAKFNIPFLFLGDINYIKNGRDDISINILKPEVINYLYNLVDVYFVASKSEGGPKSILEASLCKTLIISTDVGFANEYLHSDLIVGKNSPDEFIKKIILLNSQQRVNDYLQYNYNKVYSVLNEISYKTKMEKILSMVS